jgi:hypothetical protein
MTTFAVCVPWRGGVPSREAIWAQVQTGLAREGYTVCVGDSDPDLPFNLCQARNRAAVMAGDVDVLVFNDADTYIPPAQLREAVRMAAEDESLVQPYTRFLSMNPYTGQSVPRVCTGPVMNSGNLAIARALFERMGGWDERFTDWGWEDAAFLGLARAIAPFHAVQGTIVAFEHTRKPEETMEGAVKPDWIEQYKGAAGDPDRIIADVKAARRW